MSHNLHPRSTLLFIENREKSRFWSAAAALLLKRGHDVHWLVQNPLFAAGLPGTIHILPFPINPSLLPKEQGFDEWPALVTDRGRQFFGAGSGHYAHYAAEIDHVFDTVQPHLVIGEATLFHELLATQIALSRAIAFVHPTGERYPQNRFVMFEGLTQNAYVESGHAPSFEDAKTYVANVVSGHETLAYMKGAGPVVRIRKLLWWMLTRSRVFAGRLMGERFNTPTLARKWQLSQIRSACCRKWDELAREVPTGEKTILHPLQMEPEANIDVWGRPYFNQIETIRRLLNAAPAGVNIALKSNPKPKYEMSPELIAFAAANSRIILLPRSTSMDVAMSRSIGAVTVCGTVGFEAAFGKGRCISLRHPLISSTMPKLAAESPEDAVACLMSDAEAGMGSLAIGARLLQAIHARSFPGFVSDPFSNPSCLDPANIVRIADGLEVAIAKAVENRRVHVPRQVAA